MGFNDLLETVGGVGYFQFLHSAILLLPVCFVACHNFLQNFTAAIPAHHCTLLSHANRSGLEVPIEADLLMASIPLDRNQMPERCLRYSTPQWQLLIPNASTPDAAMKTVMEPCAEGWSYDTSLFSSTIITEWNLVCEQRRMKQMAQSIYMAGVLVGAVVIGGLSDRFGRRALLIWSYLQLAVAGTCVAFLPWFSAYCAFRFLCGMAFSGVLLNTISLILEWMPPKGRTLVATLFGYGFTSGQLVLAGLAYGIRDWHWLQFTVSVPFFLFFLYSWWVPESSRWLILKKKPHLAMRNLQKVARINGKREEGDKITLEVVKSHMEMETLAVKSSYSALDLFRTPALRRISVCLMLLWFSTSFAYYGLAMDLQKFQLSIFLIQVLFGAIDFPAKLVSAITMSFIGRRFTQGTALILAGLMILANIFVPEEMNTMRTVLAALGKGCLASSFTCAYLYSGELYPTVIRQTGMGFVSMNARIGSMVAPLILIAGDYASFLPPAIYGVSAIIAGTAAYFLMETLNCTLPDTIEDVESRARCKIFLEQKEAARVEEAALMLRASSSLKSPI
ncbi:solute carrier family 22 member 20-like [Rhinatrema bivittatum]|uniref:solute carrier family 22 member 20-like n=1 Tax=Rhinatrema bivittatum TaxID=194408 RepID=UPI001126CD06|nr:solute carrier family 22 member 20-like [Rhinatrema bivittatum]XP_029469588.1 solute carrier family 22 member 20-like [Rhinatrema bivittatum]XP_029469589.1 solute carrier family 22 member 20-like [Rhinatrema bivittatum]XP_029469590.1 solute carrier family 22 member 20-like [Rhinatrema bivittatum]